MNTYAILLIEDDDVDAEAVYRLCHPRNSLNAAFEIARAANLSDGLERLKSSPVDAVFLDLGLPESRGAQTYERLQAQFPDVPVVVLTHADDELLAEQLVSTGVQDFVVKGRLSSEEMVRATLRAIDRQRLLASLRASEEALRHSEERYRATFDQAPLGIATLGADRAFRHANRRFHDILGYDVGELIGLSYRDITPPSELVAPDDRIGDLLSGNCDSVSLEQQFARRDGETVWARLTATRLSRGGGDRVVTMLEDVTERKRAASERAAIERQMQQTQKLESLGVLAGGIAHDFNNILTVILGYANLAAENAGAPLDTARALEEIARAAEQAAGLCDQMLAYAGRAAFNVAPVDLTGLVRETEQLLRATVSKKADVQLDLSDELPAVCADSTQLRQVVMNLVTNASEAVEDAGGMVSIETGLDVFDEETLQRNMVELECTPGKYVYVKITDTGCGMDVQTIERVFDPFFTTKRRGRGLGMAAVLGIVRGHRGAILCDSIVGRGTTFTVLFPPLKHVVSEPTPAAKDSESIRLAGSVLVVDDEPSVGLVIGSALRKCGMVVTQAADGREALDVFEEANGRFDLAVVDVSMPRLGGFETLKAMRRLRPDARVILTSGYAEQEMVDADDPDRPNGFLHKPFRLSELFSLAARVLAQAPPGE